MMHPHASGASGTDIGVRSGAAEARNRRLHCLGTMQSHYYIPPRASSLAPHVLAIWRLDADGEYCETILPKGNLDLLFNLGARISVGGPRLGGSALQAETAAVAGLQTAPLTAQPNGAVCLLGVSLRIETAAALLPLPPGRLIDLRIDGADVFPEMPALAERLHAARTFPRQCRILVGWLRRRLHPSPATDWIAESCERLRHSQTGRRAGQLAGACGISERQMRRRFLAQLNLGPAYYLRLYRFTRALQLISRTERLTDVAYRADYFDQSHFCREFRAFAGMSPADYRARQSRIVGHLFE